MLQKLLDPHPRLPDVGALLLRLTLAGLFISHLYGKFVVRGIGNWWGTLNKAGYSDLVLAYTISAEILAAALLTVGLLTRVTSIFALPMMLGATSYWMQRKGFYFTEAGYELPLVWSLMLVVQACLGGGPISIDALLARRSK